MEAEAVPGREFRASVQKLVEQVAEKRRSAPVHGVGQRGFGDRLHSKVVQPRIIGQKSVADFQQGLLSSNLRVQAGEELPPSGEMLAVVVGAVRLDGLFKAMSGMNWKSWEKMVLKCFVQGKWCLNLVV